MSEEQKPAIDLSWIKERIASVWGRDYWRSLSEVIGAEEFQQHLKEEFPDIARPLPDDLNRREFLKLMGASLALAGLSGCTRQPLEKIVPYVKSPENMIPGKPLYFATAMPFNGTARGLLVESHMGRPTKIEGNPSHPESLGATDTFAQASILGLYDPDRSQVVKKRSRISSLDNFLVEFRAALDAQKSKKGAGFHILSGSVSSPVFLSQMEAVKALFPEAKWHRYEPVNADAVRRGSEMVFGEPVQPVYRFENAEVILSLDSDFLSSGPGFLKNTREFSRKRRVYDGSKTMNRLYAAESVPTNTGTLADHRLSLKASQVTALAFAFAREFGIVPVNFDAASVAPYMEWVKAVARDLKKNSGASLVVAGEYQPAEVHALAHVMNEVLGNTGKTVYYVESADTHPKTHEESLKELASDLQAGKVDLLLILDANPVFDAPSEMKFGELINKASLRVYWGLYEDETSDLSHWHVPAAHYLESWSDARTFNGAVSVIQPLIEPLYGGKTAHEMLSIVLGESGKSAYDIVREYWKKAWQGLEKSRPGEDFEKFWRRSLHDGVVEGTAFKPREVSFKKKEGFSAPKNSGQGLEIMFRPDPGVWDGRFANNAWLQELPKPLTKLTWDNAVWISPRTAENLRLQNTDKVRLTVQGRQMEAPVWIVPGHPENALSVYFGYGRVRSGKVGAGTGFNAYPLRTAENFWSVSGVQLEKTGKKYKLACTQDHQSMEGRNLVRSNSLQDHLKNPHWAAELGHNADELPTLYPPMPGSPDYAWGMAIDLNACTGCNACVAACQAENNIPVVGKHEVTRGREMHWLRIDHYYSGSPENPESVHQPVTCMHCENAPCEPVCPVEATSHSLEGLNEMTYNRCVGTRYCSNNCPYKVRRFNFLEYSDQSTEIMKFLRNPDVTVRSRGVMEKCTYCVQRINHARIDAKKEDRKIRDGEVVTACQSVCASECITFGNIKDPQSAVSKMKASPLNYGILTELNTKPRTSYLARVRNINPEVEALEHV